MENIRITGTQIEYYYFCHRQLWLFSHQIAMEHNSEDVEIGRLVHQDSYKREHKELEFEGIKIDFMDIHHGVIYEVKKSDKFKEAHIWQLKYYLYYFRNIGLELLGEIDYPKQRERVLVSLEEGDREKIEEIIQDIVGINRGKIPECVHKPFCKRCSYYELCYV